jgi:hypothetical protein
LGQPVNENHCPEPGLPITTGGNDKPITAVFYQTPIGALIF